MPAVVPATRVQLADTGLNVPVLFVEKVTEPVGVTMIPSERSITVAVQET
jgi:hypothetical protein